jgi:hypothetical protein
MSRCNGFSALGHSKPAALQCHPSTVVYGHAAAKGLDIKRWSSGLDSGCVRRIILSFSGYIFTLAQVYGRRLTALVLGSMPILNSPGHDPNSAVDQVIPYGDAGEGWIVSVAC